MSQIAVLIRHLAAYRNVAVSQHAAVSLRKRSIVLADIVAGAAAGEVIEDYPTFHKGPALLMVERDGTGAPLHVVWGIETGTLEPAVIVTAYHPDPSQWSQDFKVRKP